MFPPMELVEEEARERKRKLSSELEIAKEAESQFELGGRSSMPNQGA